MGVRGARSLGRGREDEKKERGCVGSEGRGKRN